MLPPLRGSASSHALSMWARLTADERAELIRHMSLIKRNALAAPFTIAFEEQKKLQAEYKEPAGAQQMDLQQTESKGELMIVNYREGEAMFIRASHDRVTIIFSTVFEEETDRIFGRVFLQEFYDARKLQSLQSAPQVTYSNREPPLEIRHIPGLKKHENVGYVTFSESCVGEHAMLFSAYGSPLAAPLCQPRADHVDHLAHPALPRLPALPHQVLQGIHAVAYALPRRRVPQDSEPRQARAGGEGAPDRYRPYVPLALGGAACSGARSGAVELRGWVYIGLQRAHVQITARWAEGERKLLVVTAGVVGGRRRVQRPEQAASDDECDIEEQSSDPCPRLEGYLASELQHKETYEVEGDMALTNGYLALAKRHLALPNRHPPLRHCDITLAGFTRDFFEGPFGEALVGRLYQQRPAVGLPLSAAIGLVLAPAPRRWSGCQPTMWVRCSRGGEITWSCDVDVEAASLLVLLMASE